MTDDFDALLDAAQLPERSLDVCLRADLVEQYKQLRRDLEDQTEGSLAGGGTNQDLADLEARIRAATTTFTLRALPREEYRKLLAQHPARKDNAIDRASGLHMEAFIAALIRACTVSPDMTDARWAKMEKVLSTGQWERLQAVAHMVNSNEVNVPF